MLLMMMVEQRLLANFNLHVKNTGKDVAQSPAPGVESPGTTYTLAAGTYTISEDTFAGYTASYSGDSDLSGNITLAAGENKTVTITNNDIACYHHLLNQPQQFYM